MKINSILAKKDRIVSVIFMLIAFGFMVLYVRESGTLEVKTVDLEGCESHKQIMVNRSRKLQAELDAIRKGVAPTAGVAAPTAAVPNALVENSAANLAPNAAIGNIIIQDPAAAAAANLQAAIPQPGDTVTANAVSPTLLNARINAINKIIQLTPEQQSALEKHFTEKFSGQEPTQTFEDIIGAQNADFYKEQANKSFNRAMLESFEKEALYVGSKIGLTPDQEKDLIAIMQQIYESMPDIAAPDLDEDVVTREGQLKKAQENVRFQKEFTEKLRARITDVLTEDQVVKYLELKAQSAQSEMELWHE